MGLGFDDETGRGKRRSPAALEWASRASFGKLAFGGLGGRYVALLVIWVGYGETPIAGRIGGHHSFAKTTEVATGPGPQNLSLTLEACG
jgi:hypothetical protein